MSNPTTAAAALIKKSGFRPHTDDAGILWAFSDKSPVRYGIQSYRTPAGRQYFRVIDSVGEPEHVRTHDPVSAARKAVSFLEFHIAFDAARGITYA